jgi:hypothetical protein
MVHDNEHDIPPVPPIADDADPVKIARRTASGQQLTNVMPEKLLLFCPEAVQ